MSATAVLELPEVSETAIKVAAGWYLDGAECPHCDKDTCDAYEDRADVDPVFYCYSLCKTSVSNVKEGMLHYSHTWFADGSHKVVKTPHTYHPVADSDACEHCGSCVDCCECNVCGECEEPSEHCTCAPECTECYSTAECGDCDCCSRHCECNGERIESFPYDINPDFSASDWQTIKSHWAQVDPVQSMADFYLLSWAEGIVATLPHIADREYLAALDVHATRVTSIKRNLVVRLDRAFQTYVARAIGGELRHHGCTDSLSQSRSGAGREFVGMVRRDGSGIVWYAAEMFRDGSWSAGFGGEPWAIAADVLAMRIDGTLPDWAFVDRVFSLQHNGGSLLNKIEWANHSDLANNSVRLCQVVGNAHHARETDVPLLMAVASAEVLKEMRPLWKAANHIRRAAGSSVERMPTDRDGCTIVSRSDWIDGVTLHCETRCYRTGVLKVVPGISAKRREMSAVQVTYMDNNEEEEDSE